MKRKIRSCGFSLSKKLFACLLLILKVSINPIHSSEIDYMYDLGDGGLDEDGFEFGDVFPMSLNRDHNKDQNATSGILTFDIDTGKNGSPNSAIVSSKNHGDEGSSSTQTHGTQVIPFEEQDESSRRNGDKFLSQLSLTEDYVFGTLLVIFGFLSIAGNGSILLVFCFRHRRLSPAEVFLVNLGIVDILLAVASYPMSMFSSFKHHWPFGEIGCTMYAFVCYFLGVASIFSVTAIALIRYLKTCAPVLGNQITCWTSCKMIALGYVISLIWALMPLVGFGNYGPEPFGLSCTLDWVARDRASRLYILLVTIFCVILPLFLIVFAYTQIILLVKQSDALVRSNGVNKRNMKSDIQLTWISGFVTLGFLIGWGPYTVVSLFASYRGEVIIPMWATPIPVLLAKSSIAYNPLIYMFFTARYRDDFKTMLQRWLHLHFKGNEKNNNGNAMRRAGSGKPKKDQANEDAENISPRNSASSSMTTRQFTTTTTMHITNNNIAVASENQNEIPLQQFAKDRKEQGPNNNNNNGRVDDDDDIDEYRENESYKEEKEYDDDESHLDLEASIIIVRDQNINRRQETKSPSHVVTMFTGNGVSTVVSSSSSNPSKACSAVRNILVASLSLFSLRSASDGEQQV